MDDGSYDANDDSQIAQSIEPSGEASVEASMEVMGFFRFPFPFLFSPKMSSHVPSLKHAYPPKKSLQSARMSEADPATFVSEHAICPRPYLIAVLPAPAG
jgi:hypothetical protein